MAVLKKPEDIDTIRECGKRHAALMHELVAKVAPGVSTKELDDFTRERILAAGDTPALLDYTPRDHERPYPATTCISVNDEVVHGIPNEKPRIIKEGDIVSLDFVYCHKGLYTDMAVTVPVGKIDETAAALIKETRKALNAGIKAALGGKKVGDISFAIESALRKTPFSIVQELCGHGLGYSVHDDPYVPNFGKKGTGPTLKPGMIIAIEPIVNEGMPYIELEADDYTYKTMDGKRSAHFEHTVLITNSAPEILTV
jgi:methionyl aminopeptidase